MENMDDVKEEERKNRTLDLLLLLKNDFEIKNLPKICEELIVLAEYESCQNVLVQYNGHLLVLETMSSQSNDKQTQQTCCDALYCMMNSNDKLRELIQKSPASGQVIEALEKFPEVACIQAAGLQAISLLATSKTVCNRLIYDEEILSVVLNAMASFPMDAGVQAAGCMALHYLLAADVEDQKQFFAEEKYHVIIVAIENHADNPSVVQEAFWALNTIAFPDETYDVLLSTSHKHLFSAMARFSKNLGVQMVCCAVIETFARTDESNNFLEVNGASRLILAAIRNFPRDSDLQAVAFNLLDILGTAIDNNSKVSGSNSETDWIEEAHTALTTHQNQPQVMDAVCRSIIRLLIDRPECIAKSDDEDLNLSLDSPILACIMLYMENACVAESACTALYQVMTCSEHFQRSLMEKGVDNAIKETMQAHSENPNVLRAACQALLGLCNLNEKHKAYLIQDQSIQILNEVFEALRHHSDEPTLVRAAIQLVTCLAEIDVFRNQCLTEGVHEVILESMVGSKMDASTQSVMLEALAVLSTAEGMVDILSQSDAYCLTVDVMNCHPNNIDIIIKGCILLQALLSEVKELSGIEKTATVIIQAMEHFADVDNTSQEGSIQCIEKLAVIKSLQEEGCVVLLLLAGMSMDVAKMLVDLQIHDRLFHILEKYDDELLVNLACECLAILSCFKDQILSSACMEGRLQAVELLVQLGADVNAGDGSDLPIINAINNHNVPLVEFLLKQGVNDLHGCLKKSLSENDNEITGLLLMHIGLDIEAGIVSWSGLQLSDVHPKWFYSTFYSASELAQEADTTDEVDGSSAIAQRIIITKKKREQRQFRKSFLTGIDGKPRSKVRPRGSIGSRLCALNPTNRSDVDSRRSSFGFSSGEDSVLDDVWSSPSNSSGGRMRRASTSERLYNPTPVRSRMRRPSMDESVLRQSWSVSSMSDNSFLSIYHTSSSSIRFLPVNPQDPRLFESYAIGTSPDILLTPNSTSDASRISTPPKGDTSSSTSLSPVPRNYQRTLSLQEKRSLFASNTREPLSEYYVHEDSMDGTHQVMPDIIVESCSEIPTTSTPLPSEVRKRRSQSVACTTATEEHEVIQCRINFLDLSSNRIPSLAPLLQAERQLLRCFICLQKLDLSNNMLFVFPPGLSPYLSNLKHLDLRGNKLKDLPTHMFASNKLETLDLSHNKISDISRQPGDSCFSLHELNLSNNYIQVLPKWLCNYVPALQILNISSNNLEKLENIPLQLLHLRTLKLCGNTLVAIPDKFLLNMSKLETLHASNNQLTSLPDDLGSHMTQLTTVKLSKNNLAINEHPYIPRFLLKLPWVKSIDLSGNRLTVLPDPSYWKSQSLRELLFADNSIRKLDLGDSIRSWRMLERLSLRNNKLSQIPKELGQLTSLTTLDLSQNRELSTLPDELGRLNRLWELPLDGLRLDLPPAILKGRTKDIVTFLHQRLKRAVPYNRMKLMLVGYGGRGKTTLIRRLQREKVSKNIATVGVNVREWKISVKHARKPVDFLLSTWDFAGQEDFYSTHPCFLTGRALYLVVFDLSKGVSEINTIRPWLLTIQALAPSCPVILVGTHKDKVPKDQHDAILSRISQQIQQLCSVRGFPKIQEYVEVSNTSENESIDHLRKVIARVIERMKIRGKPIIGQMIPHSYLTLQKLISRRAQLLRDTKKPPVLFSHQINQMIKDENVLLDENELPQAVRFLHETGVMLHYDDPSYHLSDLYFIEPEWLCKVMARVVTVEQINPFINQNGILGKDKLRILLSDFELPGASQQQYLRLLEKFDIALPISDSELLIPCKMPNKRPAITLPVSTRKVSKHFMLTIPKKKGRRAVACPPQTIGPPVLLNRYYDMPYIPIGLWSRLILRILLFAQDRVMQNDEIYNLVCNSMSVTDDSHSKIFKNCNMRTEYWREGIYVCWSNDAFMLVEPKDKEPDVLSVTVPNSRLGQKLLGLTCDLIDDLVEEWFPGLMEIDPLLGRPLLQKLVPCSYCSAHVFDVDDLLQLASQEEPAECNTHAKKIDISQLAPDLALTDIEEKFYLDRRQFRFKESSENLLGDGGFGSVYKGMYKNKQVAVKVFNRIGDIHPHRMLRQEISVLRHLRHPSLISLEAVGINPRMLILEYASSGALSSIWKSGYRTLTRSQQHRIALQVAEGLVFLHQNNIVYRDLKPDNILIFSLNLGMMINAKIADYGISKFTTRYGLKSSEGTPGYRAPEVIRGTATYNTEVDVYSFGIVLYELVTGGKKPFEDLDFRNELDDAVVKGRKLPPLTESGVAPWPELQELIDLCLEHIPENRPTSEQAYERLSAPELLCLRNTFPLFKGVSVECTTVRVCNNIENEEALEVWFAGGDTQMSILCKVNIAQHEQDVMVQGKACKHGRALCMVSAGKDAVLVGMQTSVICVFDANSELPILKHTSSSLPDSVLSLVWKRSDTNMGQVYAGLADGQLLIFNAEHLIQNPDCKPEKSIQVGSSKEPIKCMTATTSKLWLGCGGQPISLELQCLEEESDADIRTTKSTSDHISLITCMCIDQKLWLARRKSSIIEIHDMKCRSMTNGEAYSGSKQLINVAEIMRTRPVDAIVKSMIIHSQVAWVGTSVGHICLIDTLSLKLITVVKRHNGPVRSLTLAQEQGYGKSSCVISTGVAYTTSATNVNHENEFSYALVWDAEFKSHVRSLNAAAEQRSKWIENSGQRNWAKIREAAKLVSKSKHYSKTDKP